MSAGSIGWKERYAVDQVIGGGAGWRGRVREDKKVNRRRGVGRGGMEVGRGGSVEALHQAGVLGAAGERVRVTDGGAKGGRGRTSP